MSIMRRARFDKVLFATDSSLIVEGIENGEIHNQIGYVF